MSADDPVALAVTVVCESCGDRYAGNMWDPLPETWESWVAALHRVEQALHAATDCDQPVKLRLTRVGEPSPVTRLEPA